MNNEQISETTLRDYLRVLFRHKTVIALTIITVCATVFVGLKLKTEVYESKVKMLITAEKQVEATYLKELYSGHNVQQTLTQSEIVKSNPVLNRVVRSLALDQRPLDDEKQFSSSLKGYLIDYQVRSLKKKITKLPEEQKKAFIYRRAIEKLKQSITVEPIRDTNMFTIAVRDYNPIGAAIIANVVSRSYVMFDLEQQMEELKLKYGTRHPTILMIKEAIDNLNKTLDGSPIDDLTAIGPASVKIMEQASVASQPTGTSKVLTFLLAVIMSIFLSVMLAFVFEYTDQTIKSPQDIKQFLKLPFIGSIKKFGFGNNQLINGKNEKSRYVQSYRELADQICLLFKNEHLNSLLIASATVRDGSPKVTANVGYYIAKILQHKVLIIDANLRASSMSRLLKFKKTQGLASYLNGEASLDEIIQKGKDDEPDVITADVTAKNPVTLLESSKMKDLLQEVSAKYEIVLIDCANVRDFKDATVLSSLVDGIVLTVSEGQTRRQVVQNVCEQLQQNKEKIKGVILNNRTFPLPKFVYDMV